ncbi:RDD family protein [Alteromonas oceani]|uniref:RDD family protein n=1 Tax=Alteromonas oceani TaxID=2071609 RepID=A0ABV7JUM8_9ALTE|nr:RDD family protein [Alteromonas oceani]
MTQQPDLPWISGFWRRIVALIVDSILLALGGFALGVVLESVFIQMGSWSVYTGFFISLGYFGVMNSRYADGQTLGKKLLGIRVVDGNNQTISLGRSLLRYCVYGIPVALQIDFLPADGSYFWVLYPIGALIIGGSFSILYLYVFNRRTRQSLHDLVVGTYVVYAGAQQEEVREVWKPHLVIVALLFIVGFISPRFIFIVFSYSEFEQMLATRAALMQEPGVNTVGIMDSSTSYYGEPTGQGNTLQNSVDLAVYIDSNRVDDMEYARELAEKVLVHYPDAMDKDVISVDLYYGYDIGIWSSWDVGSYEFNPSGL